MPKPTKSAGDATFPLTEDQAIRQRMKGLTSQVLQQGPVDPEAVRDLVRAMIGRPPSNAAVSGAEARELFADGVRELDEALVKSASAAHGALQQLAARGKDLTDNDLKEALVSLRKLEEDYMAAANRVAEAMSGNLRREITELGVHAQNVGVEASARFATMMGEFASGISATSGLATMRGASVRMALLASGMLAGVADALRDQTEAKKAK
ncbi:MAG: DUF6781 family protein [Xanthobacteraceae bacterium]|jgi:hypothetical protein